MSRFTSGWVRLDRKAAVEDIGENPICLALWVWLLSAATIQKTKIRWHGQCREIESGMVLFSARTLSDRWKVPINNLRRQLSYLASSGRIRIESGTHGILVTICNWTRYQENYKTDESPVEHDRNTTGTPVEHEWNYIERITINNKQETIGGEKPSPSPPAPASAPVPKRERPNCSKAVAAYVSAFQGRFGKDRRPVLTKKDFGILQTLLKSLSENELCLLLGKYLKIDDAWFKKKHYDLPTFSQNLNVIQNKVESKSFEQYMREKYEERGGELC